MASFLFTRRIVTMIFLDADDKHWILARTRAELAETLLSMLNIDNDAHLLRLAAACLDCEEEAIMITEQ